MADPIEIRLTANTSDVVREAKKAGESFEDFGSSLDDVARDADRQGQKIGDNLSDGIKDGVKDAQKATDRLEPTFNDIAGKVQKQTKGVGDSIGADFKRGTQEASEGVDTLKENTGSNLKEVAASFDGSAQGIADGFQGLIAEVAEGFGPIGLAAGAAAAIGIGLIQASIEGGQEQTQQWKEDVAELGQEFINSGKRGAVGADYLIDKLKQMATETDDSKDSLKKLYDLAEQSGSVDLFDTFAQNVAGAGENIDDLLEKQKRQLAATREQDAADSDSATSYGAVTSEKAKAQQQIVDKLQDTKKKADEAKEAQDLYVKAGGPELQQKADLINQVNDAYDESAGSVEDYIDKETGLLDVGKYIAAMEQRSQALIDYQNTLATSSLSPEAKAYISSQGYEQAAILVAGYAKATPEQQGKLNAIWSESGKQSSGAYSTSLQNGLPTTVKGPTVVPTLDDSAVRKGLRDIGNGVYSPLINARFSVKVT